jgi:hypothetical protein
MADYTIELAPLDEVLKRWREIEPLLKRATRHSPGTHEPIDLLRQAFQGRVGIWLVETLLGDISGVVVTDVRPFPRRRVLAIDFIAGRGIGQWWPLFVERMDQHARERGCTLITAYGRPGWVRFWKSRGIATRIASEVIVREL